MSPADIKAEVDYRQKHPRSINIDSTGVDFAFLLYFNQLFERVCIHMNNSESLNYLCEVFVSRLNNHLLRLETVKDNIALNSQMFVWKFLPNEIDESTTDMLKQLDLDELMQIDGDACIKDQPQ